MGLGCGLIILEAWREELKTPRRRTAVERQHESSLPVPSRPFYSLFPAAVVAPLRPAGEISLAKLAAVLRSPLFLEWFGPRLRSLLLGLAGCALGAGLSALGAAAAEIAHFVLPLAELSGVAGAAVFVPRLAMTIFETMPEPRWLGPKGAMGADATLVSAALRLFNAVWLACRGAA